MVLVMTLGPMTPGVETNDVGRAGACVLFGLGAVFGVGGAVALGDCLTIFPRPTEGCRLVRHGVYRWVRHPLYTSLILLAAGWSLFWWSWPTFASSLALVVFLNAKAAREEGLLRERFPEYGAYCDRVKRFIPGVF